MPRRLTGGTYEIPDAAPDSPPPPNNINPPRSVRLKPHEEWLLMELMRRTNYGEAEIWRIALADICRKEGVSLKDYPFPIPGDTGYKHWKRRERELKRAAKAAEKEST